jgi:hypothetical protein
MGQLTPHDIASYIYCPLIYKEKRYGVTAKPLTFFESCVRAALVEGERNAVLKDSVVTPKKLLRAWDKTWWPAAAERNLPMKEANDVTLKAAMKLTDYCKYDISDYSYPTASVNAGVRLSLGRHTLTATADVVKINLNIPEINTILVNFTNRQLNPRASAFDPVVRATAYAFYRGKGETVSHIYVSINEELERLAVISSTFYPEDMEGIRKMLYHVEQGISTGALYMNPFLCEECNQCKNIKL